MKRHLPILFLLGSLLAAPIFFSESPSYAQSCHEDGSSQDAGCEDTSTEPRYRALHERRDMHSIEVANATLGALCCPHRGQGLGGDRVYVLDDTLVTVLRLRQR